MVSVVILSYNTRELTLKCIEAVTKSKDVELEILVLDNASSDGSAEAVWKKFPQIKLVKNDRNVGFGAGNNQGMKMAAGEYVLLLNSDAFVHPDTLAKCLYRMHQGPVIPDVLGCRLINTNGETQHSTGYFPTLRRIFQLMIFVDNFPIIRHYIDSLQIRDKSRYDKEREIDWVMGAFVLLKKEVFIKTGGFDETYFMYGEEVEWMYRIKKAGYKIIYWPGAAVEHIGGASTKDIGKMFLGGLLGYWKWYQKYGNLASRFILRWIMLGGTGVRAVVWRVMGKPDWAEANARILPQLWRATG